jgi:hypothetical protein
MCILSREGHVRCRDVFDCLLGDKGSYGTVDPLARDFQSLESAAGFAGSWFAALGCIPIRYRELCSAY